LSTTVPTASALSNALDAVLVVENSPSYAAMVAEAIRERLGLPVTAVTSLADARRALMDENRYFLVLTGLVLADADQQTIIDTFVSRGLPTVVVSGVYDETIRQRILGRSVVDCVLKSAPGNIDYLVWLVQRLDRNRRLAALVVDDSLTARSYTAALLAMYGFRVVEAGDGATALDLLASDRGIRLVVVDYQMPGMDGIEFTRRVREHHARDKLAIIGVSASERATLVAQFLKNGANDFLHKPYSREEFFCRISQNADNLDLIGTLQDLATKDFLTGLPNRRHFFEQARRRFDQAVAAGRPLAVAMLDIDHFKHINDTWGHDTGDAVLRAVAATLALAATSQDLVARFGGEEFCMLAPDMPVDIAMRRFERLRRAIADLRIPCGDATVSLTVSIGVCPAPRESLHAMLSDADRLLYLAKAGGRNRVVTGEG
jgi:diguanylate cyclase (GGDEF)-like protein